MKNFTPDTNKEINGLLDKAFEKYGLEYNDFGFDELMTADEVMIIIEERMKEMEIILKEKNIFEQAIKAIENGKKLSIVQKELFIDNRLIWTTGGIETGFNYTIHTDLKNYKKESHYYFLKAFKCGWKSVFINNLRSAIKCM